MTAAPVQKFGWRRKSCRLDSAHNCSPRRALADQWNAQREPGAQPARRPFAHPQRCHHPAAQPGAYAATLPALTCAGLQVGASCLPHSSSPFLHSLKCFCSSSSCFWQRWLAQLDRIPAPTRTWACEPTPPPYLLPSLLACPATTLPVTPSLRRQRHKLALERVNFRSHLSYLTDFYHTLVNCPW